MGADFCFEMLPSCKYTVDREIELTMAVQEADSRDHMFDLYWDEDSDEEAREDVIETLNEYWDLKFSRDVGELFLNDIWYIVTGGMSWGDDPTDSYRPMAKLNGLFNLFEKFAKEDYDRTQKTTRKN